MKPASWPKPAPGRRARALARCLVVLFLAVAALASSPVHAAPPFEDTIAQRVMACTACHGEQGRAGPDGYYPRLAGKPAGYLYNQLQNFRDGRRHYGLMTHMVDLLSDEYLAEIAQHFSQLEAPYPPPTALPAPQATLERGRALVRDGDGGKNLPACVQCHGEKLTGVEPNFPGLLGLPQDYLIAQLGAWKIGDRNAHAPDCMAEIANRLGEADAYAVVSWLARQPVPEDAHPAPEGSTRQPVSDELRCGTGHMRAGPMP